MISNLRYTLKGAPVSSKTTDDHYKMWSSQKESKTFFKIQLDGQAEGQQKITFPIDMQLLFIMPIKRGTQRRNRANTIHKGRPLLRDLIAFAQKICKGVIYDKPCVISSLTAKKIYGHEPRTEILITKL